MINVPECFKEIMGTGICAGDESEKCEKCVFRVDLVEGDAGGYGDFFSGLSTMSGIGVDTRQKNRLTV